jgi:hypothetical protein
MTAARRILSSSCLSVHHDSSSLHKRGRVYRLKGTVAESSARARGTNIINLLPLKGEIGHLHHQADELHNDRFSAW